MKAVTIPLLPCADLDEAVGFYEALGFRRTYRQLRPNPYLGGSSAETLRKLGYGSR